jgi:hypothetical protein
MTFISGQSPEIFVFYYTLKGDDIHRDHMICINLFIDKKIHWCYF